MSITRNVNRFVNRMRLKQDETRETEPTKHAVVCRVCQGH
jgi:hypothetical protein